jgi:hypothetical protein
MSWLYMLLGATGLKAFQVCFRAMQENDRRDIEDDCWEAIRAIQ